MKKLIYLILLLPIFGISQEITNEKYHGFFYKSIVIGTVEIDGHIIDNLKQKDKIVLKATLEGIQLYDSKKQYEYRQCNIDGCKIIHLKQKNTTHNLSLNYLTSPNYIITPN